MNHPAQPTDPVASGAALVDRLLVGSVALGLIAAASHQLVAYDLWWQLAAGEWILEHGLPTIDPFSFAPGERSWIEMRWLAFVGAWFVVDSFGLNALILAKVALLCATFVVLWKGMGEAPTWVRAFSLLCALLLMLTRFKVRPELFTFLFLAAFLTIVERNRRGAGPRLWVALPLLQLLWSNTHTLWILGPSVVWAAWASEALPARFPALRETFDDPFALGESERQVLLWTAIATTVAGFCTPYLLLGYLFPLTLFEQLGVGSDLRGMISELRSPFDLAGDRLFFVPYVVVMVVSGASFALPGASFPMLRLGAWAGALAFSFLSSRNVSLFGLVAAWVMALQAESWLRARGNDRGPLEILLPQAARGLGLLLACALIVVSASDWLWRSRGWEQRFGTGIRTQLFPIEAMAFVREHELPRPVLASLADGSFLIYEGGERSVYIDGRLEVYGAAGILENGEDYAIPERLFAIVDRLDIDSVLIAFPLMRVALEAFEASTEWAPVYFDAGRVLYLRRTARPADEVERLEVDWTAPLRPSVALPPELTPRDWAEGVVPRVVDVEAPMDLGRLFVQLGSLRVAEQQFRAVLERAPEHREAHAYVGILAWARGELDESEDHLARAPSGWLERVDVLEMRARLARLEGAVEQEFDFAAIAIAAGSRRSEVRRQLAVNARALGLEDRAARVLQTALDGGRDDALLLGDLGALAAARGLWADALRHYEAALEIDPERASLWGAAASCHDALGNPAAAAESRRRARALRP